MVQQRLIEDIIVDHAVLAFAMNGQSFELHSRGNAFYLVKLSMDVFTRITMPLSLDFDLRSGILDIIATLRISFKYLHVRSHQEDKTDTHLLPWTAQMNVHAKALATDYLNNNYAEPFKSSQSLPPPKPASLSTLKLSHT